MVEWTEAVFDGNLPLRIAASPSGIRLVHFAPFGAPPGERNDGNPLLAEAVSQLHAYFAGTLREFRLPFDLHGTAFQLRVWRQLAFIPYGQTRSYAEISSALGTPLAVRAVGAANGANPAAIVVPCHRVIGANGKLVGYGGGLELKQRLLSLESGTVSLFDRQ